MHVYILVYTYWPHALENKCLLIIHDNYTSVKVGYTFDEEYVLEILRGHHRTLLLYALYACIYTSIHPLATCTRKQVPNDNTR